MFFNELNLIWRRWLEQLSKIPRLKQHNSPMVLFPDWQTYNTKSTEPLLKYLLFQRAKYQTTELSSAGQEVVSTNLKYENIYV